MQDRRDNGRKNYPPPTAYMSPAAHHRKRTGVLNLYLTLGVSIAAALAALLSVNVFFGLNAQNIQVSGTDLYTAEQIQFVGGMADGQNLIRLNTDFIANRLKKSLVYVDDVTVEKHYPDSLSVTITQAKEAADIKTKSGWCTVSQSGRVLSANPERVNTKLPEVVGYELKSETAGDKAESTDAQKTEILGDLFDRMNSLGMKNIKKIDITDRTDIKLNYDNRIEIQLGSSVDLDIKLTYIKTVLDKGLPKSYEGTLRYNGIDSGISAIPKQQTFPARPRARRTAQAAQTARQQKLTPTVLQARRTAAPIPLPTMAGVTATSTIRTTIPATIRAIRTTPIRTGATTTATDIPTITTTAVTATIRA